MAALHCPPYSGNGNDQTAGEEQTVVGHQAKVGHQRKVRNQMKAAAFPDTLKRRAGAAMYDHLKADSLQCPADKLPRLPQLPYRGCRPVSAEGPQWLKLGAPHTQAGAALIPGIVAHTGDDIGGGGPVLGPPPPYSQGSSAHVPPSRTPGQEMRLVPLAACYPGRLEPTASESLQAGCNLEATRLLSQGSGAAKSSLLPCGGHISHQQIERSEMPQTVNLQSLQAACLATS